MMFERQLDVGGVLNGAGLLSRPAEEFENDEKLEEMWAKTAFEHSEVYFNLLCSVDPKLLKLTPVDDIIYEEFRKDFPDLSLQVVNEDEMKNESGKRKWREFCEKFKDKVDNYNFGTLLRYDCRDKYTPSNTMFATRIQFLAIELARNREGYNDGIRSAFNSNRLGENSNPS